FLYHQLSNALQLISSELGVMVIRLFGISVFLEGNVIDLGVYKLQVVEACNGLRYLFPLASFGFLCAYLFRAPLWQRAVVFISTLPITVVMNSFRIGVIGILVENWGTEQAEGFLHDFEGWVIFMACVGILMVEMWLLTLITAGRPRFQEVFGIDFPRPTPADAEVRIRTLPKPFLASGLVLLIASVGSYAIVEREELVPQHRDFTYFPDTVGEWKGRRDKIADVYMPSLKLTDYIISDYRNPQGESVNFYVAYYASQQKQMAIHSPRSCIPGGGWKMTNISRRMLDRGSING
ncbi:MAG: EpsI family protein, partial [Gammaproteobacteria bacterium]|nr:EpsI family protein [Gammaproteobacteria bacterium]